MTPRSLLPAILLAVGACASASAPSPSTPAPKASSPSVSTTQEEPAEKGAALSEAAVDCGVRIVRAPGARSREEVLDADIPPHLVSSDEFLQNLESARSAVSTFVSAPVEPSKERTCLASFSDREVRGYDLHTLVWDTYEAMGALGEPQIYYGEDVLTYPRVFAVWQDDGLFRVLTLAENNDNTSISWTLGAGDFDPKALKVTTTKKLDVASLLEAAPFVEKSKTIYPFIEQYLLCGESATL